MCSWWAGWWSLSSLLPMVPRHTVHVLCIKSCISTRHHPGGSTMSLRSQRNLELLSFKRPVSLFCDHFITFSPVSALGCWHCFYSHLYLRIPERPGRHSHAHHHSELNIASLALPLNLESCLQMVTVMAKGISPSPLSNRRMLLLIYMTSELQGVGMGRISQ